MSQASLVNPVAKLDIRDILESSPSPPPSKPPHFSAFSQSISSPSSSALCNPTPSPSSTSSVSSYPNSAATPYACPQHQQHHSQYPQAQPYPLSKTAQAVFQQNPSLDPTAGTANSNKRSLPADDLPAQSPAKRQSKWSPAEDAKIIHLRGKGMKWDDISKELAGRSPISCRLHYQNYLERRSEWDEERRNKLARVYDRLKPELWTPIARELGVPWRAAEAMHWALGEQEMARRANVIPFSIAAARAEPHEPGHGRVAQRDRMIESTRVFEAQDLSTINSSPNGIHGIGPNQLLNPSVAYYGVPPPSHVRIAPIKSESNLGGYDEDDARGDEDDNEGSRSRKRRSGGETRLPGPAELAGEVQSFVGRNRGSVVGEERRRGSDGSCASGSTGSSGSNGYEVV